MRAAALAIPLLTLALSVAGCTTSSRLPSPSEAKQQPATRATSPTSKPSTRPSAVKPADQTLSTTPAPQQQHLTVAKTVSKDTLKAPQPAPTAAKPAAPASSKTGKLAAANSSHQSTTSQSPQLHFNKPHPLEPFHASFRIYVSKIPMPITAQLDLAPTGKAATWKMRFEVKSFLLHNLEESTFRWHNCHPQSIHYRHDFKGFGKHQFHDTSFYWQPPHVVNHSDSDDKTFTIPADSVDDLTVLLQAACVFREGAKNYFATSIYGDDIRHNHFKLLRHEMLKTPLGKLKTLVIEKVRGHDSDRKTLFWIAPSLNYMLVKAKHIENRLLFGEVIMTGYKGPHQPQ